MAKERPTSLRPANKPIQQEPWAWTGPMTLEALEDLLQRENININYVDPTGTTIYGFILDPVQAFSNPLRLSMLQCLLSNPKANLEVERNHLLLLKNAVSFDDIRILEILLQAKTPEDRPALHLNYIENGKTILDELLNVLSGSHPAITAIRTAGGMPAFQAVIHYKKLSAEIEAEEKRIAEVRYQKKLELLRERKEVKQKQQQEIDIIARAVQTIKNAYKGSNFSRKHAISNCEKIIENTHQYLNDDHAYDPLFLPKILSELKAIQNSIHRAHKEHGALRFLGRLQPKSRLEKLMNKLPVYSPTHKKVIL